METNSRLSTRRTKTTVTPKFISFNGNMAFAKLRQTQSLARPTTRATFLNFLINPYRLHTHNLSTSLAAQTQTQYSILQIKTIPKNTFRLSASYFIILSFIYPTSFREGPYKLSEEITQRKYTHAPYNHSSLKQKLWLTLTPKPKAKYNNYKTSR